MAFNPLPDRERRHLLQFYLAPKLGYKTRLGIAGGLIFAGLLIQLLWQTAEVASLLALSLPLLLVGNLFLLVRGYDLRPSHRAIGGSWERTTRDRFSEARHLEEKVKTWDETFVDLTCVTGVFFLVLLIGAVVFVCIVLAQSAETRPWIPVFAADAAVLILPHWITGTRHGWRPLTLRQQIDALELALAVIDRYQEPACQVQPMFEVAGKDKSQVPIGARVFIRFPDGPDDFLGLQLQVALNKVQGTNYPYLYAVLIAKKSFGLLDQHRDRIRRRADGLTVEDNSEDDVDVVVIRQHTTKTSGYHTKPAAVSRLAAFAWDSTAEVLAAGAQAATGSK